MTQNLPQQIIAMGGGGFSMEPDNLALDRYVLAQTQQSNPAVCFLPTASGDAERYVANFYVAFRTLDCRPSHLSLFNPHTADLEGFLLEQDVIYVGGGNTKSMLAVWREWGVDVILRKAYERGVVLAGLSAGAICWFQQGSTDSIYGRLSVLPCLGILPGSCCPHYDGEAERRPSYQQMISSGEIANGYALEDGAAVHFVDGQRAHTVASRPNAMAYFVERVEDTFKETPLEMVRLSTE